LNIKDITIATDKINANSINPRITFLPLMLILSMKKFGVW